MSFEIISRLSGTSRSFMQTVRGGDKDRALITALAVARAASDRFLVPTSAVDSAEDFYASQVEAHATDLIGQINTIYPFDVRAALKYARVLFLVKYRMTHPSGRLFFSPEAPLASYLGINGFVEASVHQVVHANAEELIRQTNGFIGVVDDLAPIPSPEEAGDANQPVAQSL